MEDWGQREIYTCEELCTVACFLELRAQPSPSMPSLPPSVLLVCNLQLRPDLTMPFLYMPLELAGDGRGS